MMASGHNPWGMSQDSVLQWAEVGMRLAPLEKAVEAMAQMLEDGEWAEHVSTIHKHPLAARLESAITELHNDIHQSEAAQQAPAGATDPWQQHMANQAEVIDCEALQRAMVQHGISFPEGGMEYFRASLGEMVNRFVRFAAPAMDGGEVEDAARLDFLVERRAYVVSDEDCCDGYWLHYVKPDGATWVQMSDHATPRAAIDAAMTDAARAAQKEGAL